MYSLFIRGFSAKTHIANEDGASCHRRQIQLQCAKINRGITHVICQHFRTQLACVKNPVFSRLNILTVLPQDWQQYFLDFLHQRL